MSTARDIVNGITQVVVSLNDLLKTDTVDAIVSLAKRLGVGGAVKTALDTIRGLLLKLVEFLDKVKAAFKAATQIPRLMEPLDSILEFLEPALGGITDTVRSIQSTTTAVIAGLPLPEDIGALQDQISAVRATLSTYQSKLLAQPTETKALPAGVVA